VPRQTKSVRNEHPDLCWRCWRTACRMPFYLIGVLHPNLLRTKVEGIVQNAAKTSVCKASSSWLTSSRASWTGNILRRADWSWITDTMAANASGIQGKKKSHPLSKLRERILPRL
jgi:hypothetical protein